MAERFSQSSPLHRPCGGDGDYDGCGGKQLLCGCMVQQQLADDDDDAVLMTCDLYETKKVFI